MPRVTKLFVLGHLVLTRSQLIPTIRLFSKRFNDFGKIRYPAPLLSLNPTTPNSLPASVFKIVITRLFLISDWRCRSCVGFCQSVQGSGLPALSTISAKRFAFVFSNFTGKKFARELRQEGQNYPCCLPALAEFVPPQSIAPGRNRNFPATSTRRNREFFSSSHETGRALAFTWQFGCTRSWEPATTNAISTARGTGRPDLYEAAQQMLPHRSLTPGSTPQFR